MDVEGYLPEKPSVEDVKRYRDKYECSNGEAKSAVMKEYRNDVKEGLLIALDGATDIQGVKDVLVVALKEYF